MQSTNSEYGSPYLATCHITFTLNNDVCLSQPATLVQTAAFSPWSSVNSTTHFSGAQSSGDSSAQFFFDMAVPSILAHRELVQVQSMHNRKP